LKTNAWLWIALALLFASKRGGATPTPSGGGGRAVRLNPSTGLPIVQPGTHKLSNDELRALIAKHGFADASKAFAIAKRESGGFSDVVVDTRGMSANDLVAYWGKAAAQELSVGLWQINVLANRELVPDETQTDDGAVAALKDADTNASVAAKLSNGGTTWGPWGG